MKTRNIFSIIFAVAMAAVSFSSCNFIDDPIKGGNNVADKCESRVLYGQWHGNFGMYYTYRQNGIETRYDSYNTDIVFYPNYAGATSGWGKQVDSYRYGPYASLQYRFKWTINDGIVYMNYPYNEKLNCYIRNYFINDNSFSGYFSTGTQRFSLTKISGYYNWDVYTEVYSYKTNSSYTVFSTRGAGSGSVDAGEIVGFGNSFAEE